MTCSFKNDAFGCQAFLRSESLKFTVEFKAHSSLHARMHSVTCVLWMSPPCQLFSREMLEEDEDHRESAAKKTAKDEEPLPDLPLCQLSAKVRKRPVALGISALHLGSFELFVTADLNVSV